MNNPTSNDLACPNISTSQKTQPLHLSALDSLRGLAALYVVLGHSFHQANVDGRQLPALLRFCLRFFDYGHYAVVLFIVLSGFCLMLPVIRNGGEMRDNLKKFFLRRSIRILPPYYITLLFSAILSSTLISQSNNEIWDSSLPVSLGNIITHLLLIHDLFQSDISKINPPLWSIAVEWRIYFFFPIFVAFWKTMGGWKTTITTLALSYTLFSILSLTPFFNSQPPGPSLHFFTLFAMGMLAADITFVETEWNRQLRKNIPWTLLACVTWIFAIPAYGLKNINGFTWLLSDIIAGITGMSLLVAVLSFRTHPLNTILNWQPLVKLGGFSYSIYLIHMPLIQLFIQYISHPLRLPPVIELIFTSCVGVPSVVVIGYLFFLMFEKPFLRKRSTVTP